MKIKLVCGFLGTGKTTLIKNILEHDSSNTVFLVNDFGDMGIDGEIVSETESVDIVELPSGCICCSLRTDLNQAITDIYKKYNPNRLLIEPTGIATPSAVLEALQEHELSENFKIEAVIGVVDPTLFFEFIEDYVNFFMDQIINSDIVLVNKIDITTTEEVDKVEEKIHELNPSALIYRTKFCRLNLPNAERKREVKPFLFNQDFDTLSFNSEEQFKEKKICSFFNSLKSENYAKILRAKGIFKINGNSINIDFASEVINKKKISQHETSKIIVIGENLNRDKIISDIKECIS